jgi:uncharacterized tellurite resistance protein B-like protein
MMKNTANQSLATRAYMAIQSDPDLWKAWNDCKSELDRRAMLLDAVWNMAYSDGHADGYNEGLKEGLANPYDYGI